MIRVRGRRQEQKKIGDANNATTTTRNQQRKQHLLLPRFRLLNPKLWVTNATTTKRQQQKQTQQQQQQQQQPTQTQFYLRPSESAAASSSPTKYVDPALLVVSSQSKASAAPAAAAAGERQNAGSTTTTSDKDQKKKTKTKKLVLVEETRDDEEFGTGDCGISVHRLWSDDSSGYSMGGHPGDDDNDDDDTRDQEQEQDEKDLEGGDIDLLLHHDRQVAIPAALSDLTNPSVDADLKISIMKMYKKMAKRLGSTSGGSGGGDRKQQLLDPEQLLMPGEEIVLLPMLESLMKTVEEDEEAEEEEKEEEEEEEEGSTGIPLVDNMLDLFDSLTVEDASSSPREISLQGYSNEEESKDASALGSLSGLPQNSSVTTDYDDSSLMRPIKASPSGCHTATDFFACGDNLSGNPQLDFLLEDSDKCLESTSSDLDSAYLAYYEGSISIGSGMSMESYNPLLEDLHGLGCELCVTSNDNTLRFQTSDEDHTTGGDEISLNQNHQQHNLEEKGEEQEVLQEGTTSVIVDRTASSSPPALLQKQSGLSSRASGEPSVSSTDINDKKDSPALFHSLGRALGLLRPRSTSSSSSGAAVVEKEDSRSLQEGTSESPRVQEQVLDTQDNKKRDGDTLKRKASREGPAEEVLLPSSPSQDSLTALFRGLSRTIYGSDEILNQLYSDERVVRGDTDDDGDFTFPNGSLPPTQADRARKSFILGYLLAHECFLEQVVAQRTLVILPSTMQAREVTYSEPRAVEHAKRGVVRILTGFSSTSTPIDKDALHKGYAKRVTDQILAFPIVEGEHRVNEAGMRAIIKRARDRLRNFEAILAPLGDPSWAVEDASSTGSWALLRLGEEAI